MPINVLLPRQYSQITRLSPAQDSQCNTTIPFHPYPECAHTHLLPNFHQITLMKTTEPEIREFIQVLLSCQEKSSYIRAVILLKPFNRNQRTPREGGEKVKEMVGSPAASQLCS